MLRTFTREKQAEYERGREEGQQEGWQAGQQAGIYAVAQRMTAAGFALAEIMQATGLEPEVIQALPPLGEVGV
jgi:predicted transposase/invertase (TIGR01784 family)